MGATGRSRTCSCLALTLRISLFVSFRLFSQSDLLSDYSRVVVGGCVTLGTTAIPTYGCVVVMMSVGASRRSFLATSSSRARGIVQFRGEERDSWFGNCRNLCDFWVCFCFVRSFEALCFANN